MLGILGHAVGWPLARGGSQTLADGLASYLRSLGGTIETGRNVGSLGELDGTGAVLLDVGPHQLAQLAGSELPGRYRRRIEGYRYGPGVFKLDWALDGPIPWRAAECGTRSHGASRRHTRRDRPLGAGRLARRPVRTLPTFCLPSRACSIQRGHPTAGTPRGRTATSRTARPST